MSAIDLEFVRRFTGQERVRSVEDAQVELDRADTERDIAKQNHESAHRGFSEATTAVNRIKSSIYIAEWELHSPGGPLVFSLCVAIPACLIFGTIAVYLHASLLWAICVSVLPLTLVLPFALRPPPDIPQLRAQLPELDAKARALQIPLKTSQVALRDAQQRREAAQRLLDGMLLASSAPLNNILNLDPRTMDGNQFEHYLSEIFRLQGFEVQKTGQSGDQGVDLIVVRGNSIAIQAKCYSGTVGNAAVQQAFSGAKFYGCERSAVITSSIFTNSARELALRTGCVLVEGHQLPDLIRGKLEAFR